MTNEELGKILRRFFTENEPGCRSPAYYCVRNDNLITLDGKVRITDEEREKLTILLREEHC